MLRLHIEVSSEAIDHLLPMNCWSGSKLKSWSIVKIDSPQLPFYSKNFTAFDSLLMEKIFGK
jgi:hypothetical protein